MLVVGGTISVVTAEEISPESLFHQAVEAWQMSGTKNYKPFDQLADVLLERFESSSSSVASSEASSQGSSSSQAYSEANHRLPIVGAMEESILVLERFIFEQQQGREETVRDQTLSHLYVVYATALSQLSGIECRALALDPHTLLIGADTVHHNPNNNNNNNNKAHQAQLLCVENAENAARNAATLDATNTRAQALLEQLLPSNDGSSIHERKPKEFVAELFDSFANSFDEKLLDGLAYKVPQMVGKLAQEIMLRANNINNNKEEERPLFENALDAGCGTGLAGRYLRLLVQDKLVGVDASSKMLDIAKGCTLHKGCGLKEEEEDKKEDDDLGKNKTPTKGDRPLYDDLMVLDLEEMTLENTLYRHSNKLGEGFDLIVAADVFVYFGSLEAVLNTFAKVSRSSATLIFTCEKALPKEAPLGWRLLPSGRFAHTKEHVVEMAQKAGYELETYQDIVPRMEKGEPVKGHLFGFVLLGDSEKIIDDKEL
ncbi:unnamed protein product [Cylindrotheca closterium]|uniref:Methyltransferase type 12 domain-containing protein n=1 Tax=Cylindrotheca closterium TaxID=2856 RepID=A0AAD2CMR6_9STRA|nr:unnamed protein product [Cylindrotheca closterium]